MSELMQPIEIKAPPRLEKSLGYSSKRRWVAWHWEPEINQVLYADGQTVGVSENLAWQIFLEHPQVSSQLQKYHLNETDQYWLLLDRQSRKVFVGEAEFIENLLGDPEALGLLEQLYQSHRSSFNQSDRLQENASETERSSPRITLLKFLILSTNVAVILGLGIGILLSLVSKVEHLVQGKPSPTTAISSSDQCGIGGSEDLSRFVATSKGSLELHLIGVYEATSEHHSQSHPTGSIKVHVKRQNKPLILALSSYEPVNWNIQLEPGVKVEKIIVNGYHDQNVKGVSGIPIEEYSYQETGNFLGSFIYQWNSDSQSSKLADLIEQLQTLTQTSLTSFQGCYRGTQFEVD